jgi:hypothetical protein
MLIARMLDFGAERGLIYQDGHARVVKELSATSSLPSGQETILRLVAIWTQKVLVSTLESAPSTSTEAANHIQW